MSTPNHTPEPWTHTKLCGQASGPHAETCIGIVGKNGIAVAWINLNPSQGDKVEDGFADAGRVVTCINALAGIPDPAEALRKAREALLIARTANLPECEREVIAEALRLLSPPTEEMK